jgi:glycosyltransferase involved in cell wall biosynthesis
VLTYFKGSAVPGVDIVRTNPTPWHADYEVGSSRHKFAFDVLLAIRLFRVLLAARLAGDPYRVIHGHLHEGALIGGVIGRLFGTPTVMDYQGSLTDEMRQHRFLRDGGKREWFWRKVEALAERASHAIMTSTGHAAVTLRARYPAKPVAALQDAVNTQFASPDVLSPDQRAERRAALGLAHDAPVVVFLGLLAEHQGLRDMIAAAKLLRAAHPQLRWLIYGYPAPQVWQTQAALAGVHDVMLFPGRVRYHDMPAALALGDIALAPKRSLTEGSGKILNYMAMALPTVAYDTSAQRELLADTGLFAPVGDVAQLAAGIDALLRDDAQRRSLGAAARARVLSGFSWDVAAQTMMEMYRRVEPDLE